ncbi:killer cell lectin-like receptor subfamily B member 1B allele B isoform X4 [Mauremys reevesii]|uniref:killer cell lectin-like receptor subfamily B member 1B allele B isoform X4 n=1 Tax=Mauremys reevesii TaxID=260615 RepID=UPI00193ECC17|nr:killer cell lectin-like receptor subfamily B member 1B allele B isoform X4 [Mauremys reevesii]
MCCWRAGTGETLSSTRREPRRSPESPVASDSVVGRMDWEYCPGDCCDSARDLGDCPVWPMYMTGRPHSHRRCFAVSLLVSEKRQTPAAPDCAGAGSRDTSTAECSAHLERFRSQLTQRLCHPAQPGPAGGSGCKLCPTDWQLRGDKCYWVSRRGKMWSESRADCSARGSQLLVIRDREELEFLKDLTQSSNQFWVGLSVPSPEKVWTWLDGSRLDQTQLPVSDPADGSSCGVVKGNQIHSDICGSVLQWICQRDPVPL